MTVALLLVGDGRDEYRAQTLASLAEHVSPVFAHRVEIDDRDHELGFAGAVQAGWDAVLETGADYCMHVELDFTFRGPVPVERMIAVLERHPQLAQLVLKRQPWNPSERAAGGIVEQHPDDYTERHDPELGATWTEHRRFWSTNVGIYSTRYCRIGWPQEPESEGMFTHRLLRDPLLRFAFWGAKHAPPAVDHVGDVRAGVGY